MRGLVSIVGARGLPKAEAEMVFHFAEPEQYLMEPSACVVGEREDNYWDVFNSFRARVKVEAVGTYVTVLRGGIVSPSGLVFGQNGLVYESLFPWQTENFMDRFSSELEIVNEEIRPKFGELTNCENVFVARDGGEIGYFHFINSILPKVALYRRVESRSELGLNISVSRAFAKELITANSLKPHTSTGKWTRANCLFFPSPSIFHGNQFTRSRFATALAKEMLEPWRSVNGQKRRLYLSRRDAKFRRLTNEAEIVGLLQSRGFEIVTTEGMSLKDQAALFGSAGWLVSVHGAGLSNMIFMPEVANVIEILSPNRLWPTFRSMAFRLGHRYHAAIGSAVDVTTTANGEGNEDFFCPVDVFGRLLRQFLPK
jgi:hypothetical protein